MSNDIFLYQILLYCALGLSLFLAILVRRYIIKLQDQEDRVLQLRTETQAVFDLLSQLGQSLSTEINEEKSLNDINNYIVEQTQAEAGAIFLVNNDGETLTPRVIAGMFPPLQSTSDYVLTKPKYLEQIVKQERVKIGEGIIGLVAQNGDAMLIANAQTDRRMPRFSESQLPVKSLILSPMKVHEKILGVICMVNKRNDQVFTDSDLRSLKAFSSQAAVLVDTVQLYNELSEKQRIEQELNVARRFQQLLLPKSVPDVPGVDFSGTSVSALEVGGDFYDFIWLDGHRLGLVIADVVGKGIPGAIIMTMARSVIRAQSSLIRTPRDVMREVNQRFLQDTEDKVFITMIFAIMDFRHGKMSMCRAGQEPMVQLTGDGSTTLIHTPRGIALGLIDTVSDQMMEEIDVPLNNNDVFILYTDGVVEAMNRSGDEYGRDRLLKVLRGCGPKSKPQEIQQAIMKDIDRFSDHARQHDDITMIIVKINDLEKMRSFGKSEVIDIRAH
ncbi:PP2C family protein-serine/threonine phosphatase [Candidatus Sumerlaeota bacterium]|nr:PP2C family protein-serine/threonine phosphatase [Candidatus Sumerlaeota bacterium]